MHHEKMDMKGAQIQQDDEEEKVEVQVEMQAEARIAPLGSADGDVTKKKSIDDEFDDAESILKIVAEKTKEDAKLSTLDSTRRPPPPPPPPAAAAATESALLAEKGILHKGPTSASATESALLAEKEDAKPSNLDSTRPPPPPPVAATESALLAEKGILHKNAAAPQPPPPAAAAASAALMEGKGIVHKGMAARERAVLPYIATQNAPETGPTRAEAERIIIGSQNSQEPQRARPTNSSSLARHEPGAFREAPGMSMQRIQDVSTALLGVEGAGSTEWSLNFSGPIPLEEEEEGENPSPLSPTAQDPEQLVEADPVDDPRDALSQATPVLDNRKEAMDNKVRKLLFGMFCFVFIAALIIVGAVVGAHNNKQPSAAATSSPSMEATLIGNLDLLLEDLPDHTKANINEPGSAQYRAWEWLLNHQNIANLPEWRQKQLFAMATYFYAFEGPNWADTDQRIWLREDVHECDWIKKDILLLFLWSQQVVNAKTTKISGQACNEAGEIETIALVNLKLSRFNPFIPPEIALLTQLRAIVLPVNELDVPLSDMLPTEIIQLHHLEFLVFHQNSLHGTIPNHVGSMSSMRHLTFSNNEISGQIPVELGRLSQLEEFNVLQNELNGIIPTEIGKMTSMKKLETTGNSLTGPIPTQMGLLTNLQVLYLYDNEFSGQVPSQLGLLKSTREIHLQNNLLSGLIPTELSHLIQMKDLDLSNLPLLSGTIPKALCHLQNNASCSYEMPHQKSRTSMECSLNFDCTDLLCGCNCPCPDGDVTGSGN